MPKAGRWTGRRAVAATDDATAKPGRLRAGHKRSHGRKPIAFITVVTPDCFPRRRMKTPAKRLDTPSRRLPRRDKQNNSAACLLAAGSGGGGVPFLNWREFQRGGPRKKLGFCGGF